MGSGAFGFVPGAAKFLGTWASRVFRGVFPSGIRVFLKRNRSRSTDTEKLEEAVSWEFGITQTLEGPAPPLQLP